MMPASAVSVRPLSRLLKFSTSTLLATALIAALALNTATLTVSSAFNLVLNAIEFIAAKTMGEALTIRQKHEIEGKDIKTKISDFETNKRKAGIAVRKQSIGTLVGDRDVTPA